MVEDQADEELPAPACRWGRSGWCGMGRHARCWFARGPEGIGAAYGWDGAGHRWTCQCPCHEHQAFAACPGVHEEAQLIPEPGSDAVQLNLF